MKMIQPKTVGIRKKKHLQICFTALFAALIAGGTFIAIPIGPIPIVLQNLFALLSGLILGPLLGCAAVALYLLAGILGAPVFAGFSGGFTRLLGPTGGYLMGYFFMALVAGLMVGRPGIKVSLGRIIIATVTGLLMVYVPGLLWLKIVTGSSWAKTLMAGFVPFLIGDVGKGVGAVLVTKRLRKTATDLLDE